MKISQILDKIDDGQLFVPAFQREYVWKKDDWELLFDDIKESPGGHFLGSVICINTQFDTHKPAELELVDGQQRATTISLLYLALYKFFFGFSNS